MMNKLDMWAPQTVFNIIYIMRNLIRFYFQKGASEYLTMKLILWPNHNA